MNVSPEYIAGLFDGEGCFIITVAKNGAKSRRHEFYYKAQAAVEIRDEIIVDILKQMYGGVKASKAARKEAHSDTFIWKATGEDLEKFCNAMLPLLIIKREQCKKVLEFLSIRRGRNTSPITEEEMTKQLKVREDVMALNKRGRQLIPNHVCNNFKREVEV